MKLAKNCPRTNNKSKGFSLQSGAGTLIYRFINAGNPCGRQKGSRRELEERVRWL